MLSKPDFALFLPAYCNQTNCRKWDRKKRSRYIPNAKLEAVRRSVYELRRSIGETLKLFEKKGEG